MPHRETHAHEWHGWLPSHVPAAPYHVTNRQTIPVAGLRPLIAAASDSCDECLDRWVTTIIRDQRLHGITHYLAAITLAYLVHRHGGVPFPQPVAAPLVGLWDALRADGWDGVWLRIGASAEPALIDTLYVCLSVITYAAEAGHQIPWLLHAHTQ